jgi:hypothetical protein
VGYEIDATRRLTSREKTMTAYYVRALMPFLTLAALISCSGCRRGDDSSNPPATKDTADVERRLKEAIEEHGKHRVKSIQLKKQPDGSYAGTLKTMSGDSIPLTNVTVQENGISWDETIDQTGKGKNSSKPDAKAAKGALPIPKRPADIHISQRPKVDWAPGKFKVGDFVEYVGPDGKFRWSEEIQEVGDHYYVYLRIIAVDDNLDQLTFKAVFEVPTPPLYGKGTKKVESRKMPAGDKTVQADLIETRDDRNKVITKKWVSPEVPFNGLIEEWTGDDRLLLKLAKFRSGK